jgi:hypothetical protein
MGPVFTSVPGTNKKLLTYPNTHNCIKFEDTKGSSEAEYRRNTDNNTVAKGKMDNRIKNDLQNINGTSVYVGPRYQ